MDKKSLLIVLIAVFVAVPVLLVTGIVGGAFFTTVHNEEASCTTYVPATIEASQNSGFGISDFGVGNESASIELSNNGMEPVTVNSVSFDGQEISDSSVPFTIEVGSQRTVGFNQFQSGDDCIEAPVLINYGTGGLSGQVLTGNITAKMAESN